MESVLNQKVDTQIIVVDDASPKPFCMPGRWPDGRIELVHHQQNKGVSAARNSGVQRADREFISFLDSDDEMIPNTLAGRLNKAVQEHRQHTAKTPLVCGCGWRDRWPGLERALVRVPKRPASSDDFFSGCYVCPGSAVIMQRTVITTHVGPFDENLRRLEDVDWFIRFSQRNGSYIPHDVVGVDIWRHASKNPSDIASAASRIMNKHAAFSNRAQRSQLQAYLKLEFAMAAYRQSRYAKTAFHLAQSWLHAPRLRLQTARGWYSSHVKIGP